MGVVETDAGLKGVRNGFVPARNTCCWRAVHCLFFIGSICSAPWLRLPVRKLINPLGARRRRIQAHVRGPDNVRSFVSNCLNTQWGG
jgi:hypothetical protein